MMFAVSTIDLCAVYSENVGIDRIWQICRLLPKSIASEGRDNKRSF